MTYGIFLLGINVGGNRKVPMADLKTLLEKSGFQNVRTLLASGNVVFETAEANPRTIEQQIEKALEARFGFTVGVIIRSMADMEALVESDPFAGVKVTPDTRLSVTFLSGKYTGTLRAPYETPGKEFRILRITSQEVCGVLVLTPDARTVDAMAMLGKEFGKRITTRNWNTILKMLKKP